MVEIHQLHREAIGICAWLLAPWDVPEAVLPVAGAAGPWRQFRAPRQGDNVRFAVVGDLGHTQLRMNSQLE